MKIWFVDNDIILKLAAYNLFWEAITKLSVKQENIRILPTAEQVFSRNRRLSTQYTDKTIQRALQIAKACTSINQYSIAEYESLVAEEGIDAGEALLVAATQTEVDYLLITGDKRFIKALASSQLVDLKQRLNKRIICLEQLILNLINVSDFDKICRRIVSAEDCDETINEIFKLGRQAKQKDVSNSLNQCVADLRFQTGELLVDP